MPEPQQPPLVLHCLLSIETGGLEVMVLNLARSTDPARFRTRLVCLQRLGALAPRFEEAGIRVDLIDDPLKGGRRTLASLTRYLSNLQPDILHTHNRGPHQHGALARKAAGVRCHVHTRHDRTYPTSLKNRMLERTATRLTDRIVAVSRDAAAVALREDGAHPDRVVTIPNGVDLEQFPLRDPGRGWRVVHVARMDPVKDQTTLLEAAAIIAAEHSDFHLDLVGDGPSRAELEELANSLGLGSVVTFHGMQGDVRPWLSQADCFVLSSRSEGLAMTLLEAMATGLPVVATNVGGNREAVQDGVTGHLVAANDPQALAQALISTLADPDKARNLGLAGRSRVEERFSLQRMTSSYEELYTELLDVGSKSRPRGRSRGRTA